MKLRTIIIDDSLLQRMTIAKLIQNHQDLDLVAAYNNPVTAKENLKKDKVDIVFLDVEMPGINGFDLLDSIENHPYIIMISGNSDYAFKAFDYDILDFLHKPVSINRFQVSVKRCIMNYNQIHNINRDSDYIYVKTDFMNRKIFLSNIKWIEALGDYVKLVTYKKNILVLSTMKSFAAKLPEDRFLRIHKSYIVNLRRIENFSSKNVEVCGQKIPISANKKDALKSALSTS